MGTDSLFSGAYIVCRHSDCNPYGAMVASYKTQEEAEGHIKFQKESVGNKTGWSILHIKDMEWIPTKKKVQIVYSPDGEQPESFSARMITEFESFSYNEIDTQAEVISLKVEEQISVYVDGELYAQYYMGNKY